MHPSLNRFRRLCFPALSLILLIAVGAAVIRSNESRRAASAVSIGNAVPRLIIDAGHGGMDGGAVSPDGLKESGVNLSIACRLYDLSRVLGLDCEMTRTEERLDYPPEAESVRAKKTWDLQRRAALVNEADNAVLLSIHQNLYPDSRPSGTQVLYAPTNGSPELAALTHENLREFLCPENRRVPVPAGKNIYLMNAVHCPAILVECGFLSNPTEAQKLVSPAYQTEIAAILCASYLQYFIPVC